MRPPASGGPKFFTFDVFGTIVDWKTGLTQDCRRAGQEINNKTFEKIIDHQAADENAGWKLYRDITARSLVGVLGMDPAKAVEIGNNVGRWPLFPDSKDALRTLRRFGPCVAMTNSDRLHGKDVQHSLGFELDRWVCAEDVRSYKPADAFWDSVEARLGRGPSWDWWHVSAYADYDLAAATRRGLTTVFVKRPHSRPADADYGVSDLGKLVEIVERLS